MPAGEIPILLPAAVGTPPSYQYQTYGTHLDFVPIVLGNGKIRLEVRPHISEIDPSTSVIITGTSIPGLLDRGVDTGVEMQAGQTLAIAGLVQTRIEARAQGVPWISELPYIGALFRTVNDQTNEIELLILVTPDWADAMDQEEVPPCGPGMETTIPSDGQLFLEGHLEVPNCCPASPQGTGVAQASLVQGPMVQGPMVQGPMVQGPMTQPSEPVTAPPPSSPTRWMTPPPAGPQTPQPAPLLNPSGRYNPNVGQNQATATASGPRRPLPAFIGPVGYDVAP